MLMAVGAHPVARAGLTDSCYHYRPAPVSLTGRLIRRTLPGPPNYQSLAPGARPHVLDLLILETPICTIPDYKDSPNTDAFQGQDTVQVRRAESTWRDVGRLTGRRVIVTGTLSEWALGPDRTPVVIDPTEVRPALPKGRRLACVVAPCSWSRSSSPLRACPCRPHHPSCRRSPSRSSPRPGWPGSMCIVRVVPLAEPRSPASRSTATSWAAPPRAPH